MILLIKLNLIYEKKQQNSNKKLKFLLMLLIHLS